ncbi:hypothetical protein JOQ06_012477, partial [Pogonophryne albipinna]
MHASMRPKITGHVPGPPETNISKFQNSVHLSYVQSSLPGKGVIEPGLTSDLECPFLGQSQPDPHPSPGVKVPKRKRSQCRDPSLIYGSGNLPPKGVFISVNAEEANPFYTLAIQ